MAFVSVRVLDNLDIISLWTSIFITLTEFRMSSGKRKREKERERERERERESGWL